jgi:hypothetical protein
MEVKELIADLTGEVVVPERALGRVAPATAWEEETGALLGVPGGAEVMNGWRVNGVV